MYNPRIGRRSLSSLRIEGFFSVDPLAPKYPHYTPYSFSGNKVIAFVELEGLEEYPVNSKIVGAKYTRTGRILNSMIITLLKEKRSMGFNNVLYDAGIREPYEGSVLDAREETKDYTTINDRELKIPSTDVAIPHTQLIVIKLSND